MSHKVFIRHTYIYQCSSCKGEWKINEAEDIEQLNCPHCGKKNCKIVLDHDWLTGKFRNWSCINCNAKHSEKTYEEADRNNRKWYHVGEYNDK